MCFHKPQPVCPRPRTAGPEGAAEAVCNRLRMTYCIQIHRYRLAGPGEMVCAPREQQVWGIHCEARYYSCAQGCACNRRHCSTKVSIPQATRAPCMPLTFCVRKLAARAFSSGWPPVKAAVRMRSPAPLSARATRCTCCTSSAQHTQRKDGVNLHARILHIMEACQVCGVRWQAAPAAPALCNSRRSTSTERTMWQRCCGEGIV